MRKLGIVGFLLLLIGTLQAQMPVGDILGSHDLSSFGTSPIKGASSAACLYCHAPHSGVGGNTPLWAQTLSSQTYSLYTSTTVQNIAMQPTVGAVSSLCLSCHDGTIAPGEMVPSGTVPMTGSMYSADVFGAALKSSHPISLKTPLVDSPNLVSSLAATGTTADPLKKVTLINGSVECTSCHEPHNQRIDPISQKFLVRDGSNGQICLSCHEPNARIVGGKNNPLAQWTTSVHATSGNVVAAQAAIGSYTTLAQFACLSCHQPHNATGASGLLRGATPAQPTLDPSTQPCATCHSGGSNLQQALPNVYGEFAKIGHPFPSTGNVHDQIEPAVLVNNRHSTCADCHNSHASLPVGTFGPAPQIRVSQTGVAGVSATDGTTVLTPAVNQYESCLRCHGTSPGKQRLDIYGYAPLRVVSAADPLNVIAEMSATASSSHPVLHDMSSAWPQPSLLPYMNKLDATPNSVRPLGSGSGMRIFCSDCHNSDDNRESGGPGPNGPHGSVYGHIMERRYEFSKVAPGTSFPLTGPGSPIQNTFVNPSLAADSANPGPYALCAKCHDLSKVLQDLSFRPASSGKGGHFTHISDYGVSCSVCHTAHGMGSLTANVTGERMVNFDVNVVAPNGASPISYNHTTNTCVLACHSYYHNADGSVTPIPPPGSATTLTH
ncbi:MAG: cytochrome c3 family protein [Acidobacteriota bacterium]